MSGPGYKRYHWSYNLLNDGIEQGAWGANFWYNDTINTV